MLSRTLTKERVRLDYQTIFIGKDLCICAQVGFGEALFRKIPFGTVGGRDGGFIIVFSLNSSSAGIRVT